MGMAGGDMAATVVLGQPKARLIGFWLRRGQAPRGSPPALGSCALEEKAP
jgi:hypothetical protein